MEIRGSPRLPNIIFYGLTTFMALIVVISFASALTWINKPFPGFLIYKFPFVASLSDPDWPGNRAGLRYMDRIAAVEDRPIRNGREVFNSIEGKAPGIPVHYVVESRGKFSKISLPITVFNIKDFFLVFFIPFFGGLTLFVLGVVVYVLKPNIRPSWVFFLLSFSLGSYMVTGFEMQSTYLLEYFHYLIIPLFPATFLHLALIFPERKRFLNRFPKLEYMVYLPALVLAVGYQVFLFSYEKVWSANPLSLIPDYTRVATPNLSFMFLAVIGLIAILFHSMLTSSDNLYRQRAKTILIGVTIAFLPSVAVELLAFFMKFNFPFNFLVFFVLFFPASFAYSIVRHNLFDADTMIRRTVGYVIATAAVVGVYCLTSISVDAFLETYQIARSKAFPVVFILIMILIFNPIRNRIQSLVDRVFFRKEYDDGKIIDKISRATTSSLDLTQNLKKFLKTLQEDMFIDMSSIMLLDPARREYHLSVAEGEKEKEVEGLFFTRDDPFVQILEREKKELTKYDFSEDPKYRTVSQVCIRNFRILYASMMIPLIFHEEVVGILNLGEKKSGKFYDRKDVELLRTLANQTALAVENARLHQARVETLEHSRKELERLNRVKSIALDHLSHELKTPLSVIQGSIRLLKHKVEMQTAPGEGEKSFETLERQLDRLLGIQRETEAIIRSYRGLEEEMISVFSLAEQTLEEVKQRARHRNVHFHLEGQRDLSIPLPPKIMADILEGLLRNAVENTPDEGMVRVVLEQKAQWILLKVRDFGVGISNENQRHLFDGLFHTQSNELYASKRPYDFNAGGKGLDLLKMKVYGQRFGFDISVGSRRCIHLPTDRDLCPGRISLCSHCQEANDCLASGGSTFCVTFPVGGNRVPKGNKEHGKETSSS